MRGKSIELRQSEMPVDAHGHDPADYQWVPVLRRPRADGWTPQRQRDFIAALADDGRVSHAARAVGMSENSCYRMRRSPGGENFARAWDVARAHAAHRLIDIAFDLVIDGCEEPVFDKDGNRAGRRMRQDPRMHKWLLSAYFPERFRHAHKSRLSPDEPPPPVLPTLEEAMRQLEPVPPQNPHMLMAPDELDAALEMADLLDGELPHWHRGNPDCPPPPEAPLGEEFERKLEKARRGCPGNLIERPRRTSDLA